MKLVRSDIQIKVAKLYSEIENTGLYEIVEGLQCTYEGIVGDRHYGIDKAAGVRETPFSKGEMIRNDRHFSAVSLEELEEVAELMGIPVLLAEYLSPNILFKGYPNLSQLPPLSVIAFEGGAALRVLWENTPCSKPGKVIADHYPERAGISAAFVKLAIGKRGIVGWVHREGTITPDQKIEVYLPHYRD